MNKFLGSVNIMDTSLAPCVPWEFQATENITPEIRATKISRQEWYRTESTRHNFYTAVEPSNPNIRISKTNPARMLHAFVADYDIEIPMEKVEATVERMKLKPAYIETSLSGKFRLVWLLPRPMPVDGEGFCDAVLRAAVAWLPTASLPGLDEGAFTDPARLYANGCVWKSTGHGPLGDSAVQVFYMETAQKFRFKDAVTEGVQIPLPAVEECLKIKYPSFVWPTGFDLESQGPSFWVEGSTSPLSAIVKGNGMLTFAEHAEKPFYTWTDLCGIDFTKDFSAKAITKATKDIYHDGRRFWRPNKTNVHFSLDKDELLNFFRVDCGLSDKRIENKSLVDSALSHIYNENKVSGGAPFLYRERGVVEYQGKRYVNTAFCRVMQPADELTPWGPTGKFPFISAWLDAMLDPHEQLLYLLAWIKHAYEAGLNLKPMIGQSIFMMGGVDVGKSLFSLRFLGPMLGGYADASPLLIKGATFNAEMFDAPVWDLSDENVFSVEQQAAFEAAVKKCTANHVFNYHKKFETPVLVERCGRVTISCNSDAVSSRILGPLDNSSKDKICVFRCASESKIVFPPKHELEPLILAELPYFLRWLLSWEVPASVPRHVRYGFAAYHDPKLMEQTHQTGRSALFKELLVENMLDYFHQNKTATEWRGTATQLLRLLHSNGANESALRSFRAEGVNRSLEQIQREGVLKMTNTSGAMKTRVWCIEKFEPAPRLESGK